MVLRQLQIVFGPGRLVAGGDPAVDPFGRRPGPARHCGQPAPARQTSESVQQHGLEPEVRGCTDAPSATAPGNEVAAAQPVEVVRVVQVVEVEPQIEVLGHRIGSHARRASSSCPRSAC